MQKATVVIMLCLMFVGTALCRGGGGAFGSTIEYCTQDTCPNAPNGADCIEFPKGSTTYYYAKSHGSQDFHPCE